MVESDTPPNSMAASTTKFASALREAQTKRNLNFQLKQEQMSILCDLVIRQKDVLAVLPTGFGKTLIYSLLPTLVDTYNESTEQHCIVIVISPLVALMEEQVLNIQETGIKCFYSSSSERHTEGESVKLSLFTSFVWIIII